MTPLTLTVNQHIPTPSDTVTSLERLSHQAAESQKLGATILLVPEASMTGYNISVAERDKIAAPKEGELSEAIARLCRKYDIAISYGYIERDKNHFFNAVQLIDRHGEPRSHYRKTHLWGDLDRTLFTAGDCFSPIVDIDGWKVGHLICYDIEFPEAVRHLALEGADLILVSTALMSPWTTIADLVVPARAEENQIYIAYANYCGSESEISYVGHSCIAGPDGRVLAKAGSDPTLLCATLEIEEMQSIREKLPYYRDRRPELYHRLTE
ncbi:MAG: carbon-nitrogen hydrolase family protein [Granulosicoccus sp.]|nr:carbon-nitrogen hydrolase family protein [Granulosicoccus sp.]